VWDDDDAAPVALRTGHHWTRDEARAIAMGIGGRARREALSAELRRLIAQRASRIRWNPQRIKRGLKPLPLPEVRRIQTPHAIFTRECRDLARRRARYDGVRYRDVMAWDPIVVKQVCEKLGLHFDPDRRRWGRWSDSA
jgi:hypothetical protein